jgi:hypothetical protein
LFFQLEESAQYCLDYDSFFHSFFFSAFSNMGPTPETTPMKYEYTRAPVPFSRSPAPPWLVSNT